MIPLDPEEIFGLAAWEALKRALGATGSLLIGSFFAVLSAFAADFILNFTPLAGSPFLPSFSAYTLIAAPFWVVASITVIIAIPNAFVAAFYYSRCEEPTARRFLIFTGIQQFCLTGAFSEWAFDSAFPGQSILSASLLWLFSIACFTGLIFGIRFWQNKTRCHHEEHLMTIAAENVVWRKKLEDAEFIPPPPEGVESPKPKPLDSSKRTG